MNTHQTNAASSRTRKSEIRSRRAVRPVTHTLIGRPARCARSRSAVRLTTEDRHRGLSATACSNRELLVRVPDARTRRPARCVVGDPLMQMEATAGESAPPLAAPRSRRVAVLPLQRSIRPCSSRRCIDRTTCRPSRVSRRLMRSAFDSDESSTAVASSLIRSPSVRSAPDDPPRSGYDRHGSSVPAAPDTSTKGRVPRGTVGSQLQGSSAQRKPHWRFPRSRQSRDPACQKHGPAWTRTRDLPIMSRLL